MNPQEDPEARIRDLERSLSDVAGTSELRSSSSELGTGQYGGSYGTPPPAPPPPPQGYSPTAYPPPPGYSAVPYTAPYTAPYANPYPTTPRSNGGFSWWWLVVATFVVGSVAVGAGVAVFGTRLFSDGTSITSSPRDRPSISGGGGILTNMPTPPNVSIPLEPSPEAPIAPGSVVTIGGFSANKTIACNEGTVNISGMENKIVLTGHCLSVNVSGIENIVTVDSADAIVASGFDNRITFKTGSPEISNSGGDNVVEQG
jgi:hypothetical protein